MGAFSGQLLLLQSAGRQKSSLGKGKGFGLFGAWIRFFYRGRVAEEKANLADGVQFFDEQFVAVDAEIGGDEAEGVGVGKVFLQIVENISGLVVQNVPLFAGFSFTGLAMDRFAPKSLRHKRGVAATQNWVFD